MFAEFSANPTIGSKDTSEFSCMAFVLMMFAISTSEIPGLRSLIASW